MVSCWLPRPTGHSPPSENMEVQAQNPHKGKREGGEGLEHCQPGTAVGGGGPSLPLVLGLSPPQNPKHRVVCRTQGANAHSGCQSRAGFFPCPVCAPLGGS